MTSASRTRLQLSTYEKQTATAPHQSGMWRTAASLANGQKAMIVPSQPFAWPSANWWIGFSDGSHSVMRDDLRCYYILYAR